MKTLERVRVADVHTPRDSFGNEFPSSEFDQQVNKDYVQELADSFKAGGEPDVALSLVRREEGGYYVADGQSRLHAMQLLGTEECYGVVDEDATVQDVIETIMRTNKKKKYEPVEESRVVQQLAAFGDDEYVGSVASIDVDKAHRVRRAREIIGEKAEQLSLDRLYAVADFEGDEDAVSKIVEAPEAKWQRVYDDLHREKLNAEKAAAFKAKAAELRVKVVDERPSNLRYACTCGEPDDLMADYMAASVRYKGIVMYVSQYWYVEAALYGTPLDEQAETAEEAERRRRADGYEEVAQKVDDACCNWVLELLGGADAHDNLADLKSLDKACRKMALGYWYLQDSLKMFPAAKKEERCLVLFALGYKQARKTLTSYARDLANDNLSEIAAVRLSDALDWIGLHVADGWEPDDGMREFIDLARGKVGELEAEPDGIDGEGE